MEYYHRAIYFVEFDEASWHFELLPEHREAVNKLRFSIYLNLSNALLKEEMYKEVVEFATKALEMEPENVKARYRLGVAQFELGDLKESNDNLKMAMKANGKDAGIRRRYKQVAMKLKEAKEKERKIWKGKLLSSSNTGKESTSYCFVLVAVLLLSVLLLGVCFYFA